jgi:hypothetical protein
VGGTPRREQGERVDVPVLADTHSEMDVGNGMLGLPGRPGSGDRVALGDARASLDLERAEVGQRRAVAVFGRDRDGEPVRRYGAGERDLAGGGRADERRASELDVDPAVLTGRVLVVADRVPAENRSVGGPRPRRRHRGCDERSESPRREEGSEAERCP